MFNTYLYKTVPLAGIQPNKTFKKIQFKFKKQTKKLIKMKFLQLLFYLWLRMYTFV